MIQQETYTSILVHVIIVFLKTSCVLVNVFGEVTGSTYSSLDDNTVLISDTTLYCVTENKNTPQVMWTHVDLAGVRTDVTSTTDTSTGVSTIQVYTTQLGYYSCEVTENGGNTEIHTVGVLESNFYSSIFQLYTSTLRFHISTSVLALPQLRTSCP